MYRCMPPCVNCREANECSRLGEPFKEPKAPRKRVRRDDPNDRELMLMPCGCLALPVELVHKLGDNFHSFICDLHGEVKITKKWRRETKGKLMLMTRVPSYYGYTVQIQEELP